MAVHHGWALAAVPIESFTVTPASSQAGGPPDITASFALEAPGAPETASSALLEPPAGQLLFPTKVPGCPETDFATANCSPQTQVGSVTLRSDSDYGLRIDIRGLPTTPPLRPAGLRIWGVPADSELSGRIWLY